MFSNKVPSFVIDLDRDEARRWDEVIKAKAAEASGMVHEANMMLARVPGFVRWLFARLYARTGGRFNGELRAWAEALNVSYGTATMLNCAYELSHLHVPKLLGCTAGVRWVEGRGMVHVRTLDWPIPSMGPGTCVFRFLRGKREFVTVGVPGQVGVLSGMVPGGYSVTINWAPPDERRIPTFNWGPAFLLREVLETCNTFDDAVAALQQTRLSTSVFYTVCGLKPHEGCVIERRWNSQKTRWIGDEPAVVTANHHVHPEYVRYNGAVAFLEDSAFIEDSGERYRLLRQELPAAAVESDLACNLDLKPIRNAETVQKMEFCPATGDWRVWRRIGPDQ